VAAAALPVQEQTRRTNSDEIAALSEAVAGSRLALFRAGHIVGVYCPSENNAACVTAGHESKLS
jgi:hypothetical protein